MVQAETKYKELNYPTKPSKEQLLGKTKNPLEEILALVSQIQALETKIQGGKTNTGTQAESGSKKSAREQLIKLKEPGPDGPKTTTVNGKTYYWCPGNPEIKGGHKPKWVAHKPEDCKALHPDLGEIGTPSTQSTASGTGMRASGGVGFQALMYESDDKQE